MINVKFGAKVTKNTAVRSKDQVQNLSDDGQITPDEVKDISDMNISMQAIHDDYLAQNDSSAQGPDYVNDGNIDNYMA